MLYPNQKQIFEVFSGKILKSSSDGKIVARLDCQKRFGMFFFNKEYTCHYIYTNKLIKDKCTMLSLEKTDSILW